MVKRLFGWKTKQSVGEEREREKKCVRVCRVEREREGHSNGRHMMWFSGCVIINSTNEKNFLLIAHNGGLNYNYVQYLRDHVRRSMKRCREFRTIVSNFREMMMIHMP